MRQEISDAILGVKSESIDAHVVVSGWNPTGCHGANSYLDYAKANGYTNVEVLNWSSSAGDWQFIISKDGHEWHVLFQENNYPRAGFSHHVSDEPVIGTSQEALAIFAEYG